MFKRKRETPPPPPPPARTGAALDIMPAGHVGAFLCADRACPERAAVACRYVDRTGMSCLTAWCAIHHEMFDGVPYCRRHAAVMRALAGGHELGGHLPEIDNRIPSLMHWITRGLDAEVRSLLEGLADPAREERLVVEGVQERPGRKKDPTRWESSWMLCTESEVTMRVTVEVSETGDPEVTVRVGRDVVARQVPTWIVRRTRGVESTSDPETEARERRDFFKILHNSIAEAAGKRRRRR